MYQLETIEDNLDSSRSTYLRKASGFVQTNPRVIKVSNDISSAGPFRLFGTLTFQYELSDKKSKEKASSHWRKVQRLILGRNWIDKKIKAITGVAVIENAQIFARSERGYGSAHFHYLIHDHPAFDRSDRIAASEVDRAFRSAAASLTHKNHRWRLVSAHGCSVDPVWDSSGVCGYVAKEAAHSWWNWADRVRFLCQDGLV